MTRPYGVHYLTEEQKKIVEDNIYFVWYFYEKDVVKRYSNVLCPEELDEILARLFFGICLAAENWEPSRGAFTTCCVWYFKSAIGNYFREKKLFNSRYTLTPFISDDNISEDCNIDHMTYYIPTKGGLVEEYDGIEKKDKITWDNISFLFDRIEKTPQEEEVILYYYKYKFTMQEVGDMLGLTRERVRQLLVPVIDKLKLFVCESGLTYNDVVYK